MQRIFWVGVALNLCLAAIGFADEGDFVQYQHILDTKCSQCHTRVRIEEAMRKGENIDEILQKMIRFGAKISAQEQKVLGVFWRADRPEPTTLEQGETVSEDPLGEFRAVLESRCTGCHSLERVEEAMAEGRSVDDLIEMMRQRGAIVTESDQKVLGTFWGSPLKKKTPK